MESLIISLLVALLGVMQNPQIPLETKAEIYQKTMPVITRYMEETKPVGEIATGASELVEVKMEDGVVVEITKKEESTPDKINFVIPVIPNIKNNEQK